MTYLMYWFVHDDDIANSLDEEIATLLEHLCKQPETLTLSPSPLSDQIDTTFIRYMYSFIPPFYIYIYDKVLCITRVQSVILDRLSKVTQAASLGYLKNTQSKLGVG